MSYRNNTPGKLEVPKILPSLNGFVGSLNGRRYLRGFRLSRSLIWRICRGRCAGRRRWQAGLVSGISCLGPIESYSKDWLVRATALNITIVFFCIDLIASYTSYILLYHIIYKLWRMIAVTDDMKLISHEISQSSAGLRDENGPAIAQILLVEELLVRPVEELEDNYISLAQIDGIWQPR